MSLSLWHSTYMLSALGSTLGSPRYSPYSPALRAAARVVSPNLSISRQLVVDLSLSHYLVAEGIGRPLAPRLEIEQRSRGADLAHSAASPQDAPSPGIKSGQSYGNRPDRMQLGNKRSGVA